ncbi:hypothetical protein HK104_005207 [Borealophlyctis nickersoniae]|nr:hypothetical protein HK104_005207 [Borealophlyctis nickersoniae]
MAHPKAPGGSLNRIVNTRLSAHSSLASASDLPRRGSKKYEKHDVEAGVDAPHIKATARVEDIIDEKLLKKGGTAGVGNLKHDEPRWKKWMSIRTSIITLFLSALIFNGLFLFLFMFLRNQLTVTNLAKDMQDRTMTDCLARFNSTLRTTEAVAKQNALLVKRGKYNLETVEGLSDIIDHAMAQISTTPGVVDSYVFPINENGGGCWGAINVGGTIQMWNTSGVGVALPDGTGRAYTWGLDSNGEYSVLLGNGSAYVNYSDPSYEMVYNIDPVRFPGRMAWTSPFVWDGDNRPYVTFSTAAIDPNGKFVGVVGNDLWLGSISSTLKSIASATSSDTVVFAVNRPDSIIIGASNTNQTYACSGSVNDGICNGKVTLLKPDDPTLPSSIRQADAVVKALYGGWSNVTYHTMYEGKVDGVEKFINIAPFDTTDTGAKYAVVLMVNQETFLGVVNKDRDIAVAVFCALLSVSMVVTVVFSIRITKPLAVITRRMNLLFRAKKVRGGEDEVGEVTLMGDEGSSRLVEIQDLEGELICVFFAWVGIGRSHFVFLFENSIFPPDEIHNPVIPDIKDFTVLSESLPIAVLITILSKYLDFMTNIIAQYDGIVADFIGDAIMAFWEDSEEHAIMGVNCALDQQTAMVEFNKMLVQKGYQAMTVRMGLHVGMVLVGNIGSDHRLKYGCVGDDVNLCSRLEGLNKRYNTRIILSNECKTKLPSTEYETRALEHVIVKGRSTPTYLHELCGTREGVDPAVVERNRVFDGLRVRLESLGGDAEDEAGEALLEEVEKYLTLWPDDAAGVLLRDRLTSGHGSGPVKLTEK